MGEAEDRQLARRIAARAGLLDVRLLKSRFELEAVHDEGQLGYSISLNLSQVDWEPGQPVFTVRCEYEVTLTEQRVSEAEGEDRPYDDPVQLAVIDFTFAALFQLNMRPEDAPAADDELKAYAATTGAFALYPFAREYVYDVTGRLQLPSLTLPAMIIDVTNEASNRAE